MTVTERERLKLVKSLEAAMGQEATGTLMEYLPATVWRDVARVSDLDPLDTKLSGKIAALDGRIVGVEGRIEGKIDQLRAGMHKELKSQARHLVVMMVTIMTAFGGMLIAAAQIYKP